jgi:hypothetical protein
MHAILIQSRVDGHPTEFDGQWVVKYDPSWRWPDGTYDGGLLETTADPERALRFANATDAWEYWRKRYGIREDGEWNRPLTAFHVVIESVPDAESAPRYVPPAPKMARRQAR